MEEDRGSYDMEGLYSFTLQPECKLQKNQNTSFSFKTRIQWKAGISRQIKYVPEATTQQEGEIRLQKTAEALKHKVKHCLV